MNIFFVVSSGGGKFGGCEGGFTADGPHVAVVSSQGSLPDSNPVKRLKTASVESPRQFFLTLLLRHRGSLWKHRANDPTQLTMWERSVEYFDLLCNLLHETKREPY